MKIHIVRHGETEANDEHRLQGHTDTPMTETGIESVEAVAQELTDYNYDVIFSSPLKRALDTAKLLAQEVRTDVRIAPELKEICYGEWEGRMKGELQEHEAWQRRERDKYHFTHPGEYEGVPGQSYASIYERVRDFLDMVADSERELVLLVTHLGVLRNAKRYVEDCPPQMAVSFTPETRQVYEVKVKDGVYVPTLLDLR